MSSFDEHSYAVNLKWSGGRKGVLSSPDLTETIEVATPPEFDGGVAGVWSPEHLYTASVVSCLLTSFLAIAEYSKFPFEDLQIESEGVMRKVDGKFIMEKVILRPVLTVADAAQEAKGIRLLEKAEHICLISRSIKSEIQFEPRVVTG
ncbi:MAG: SACOL1771 subfamily peroxiredoxin [Bacteroidetes bacterium HLUCCA01]|nr:MAG: SACOL1771 subfamily peroxiredoxin [Bacteroidetes bacterium HLUCCA01]